MKRVLFVVNPKSGRMKSKTLFFDIINTMSENDCIVTVRITNEAGDACRFVFEGCNSGLYDHVVCCGGDGTLNEAVAGIHKSSSNIPLGYIPSGSTNDYARTLGIPGDAVEAAKTAVTGEKYPIDIGCIDGVFFNYIASFGAFTSVSYNASQSLKNNLGHVAYVLEGAKDITKIKSVRASFRTGSMVYEDEYIFAAIVNSTSIGGILKLDETLVSLNDGVFEVCLVKKPKNPADMIKIVRGLLNSDFSSECFDFFRASSLDITVPEGLAWSLDGEKYISDASVRVDVIHSAVSVVK